MAKVRNFIYLFIIIFNIVPLKAQTAFEKARDLMLISQNDKYYKIISAFNKSQKVPKWFYKIKASEKRIILNTAIFFDDPLSPQLNIYLVKPTEFIKILDASAGEDASLVEYTISVGAALDYDIVTSYRKSNKTITKKTRYAPYTIDGATQLGGLSKKNQELAINFFSEFRKRLEQDTLLSYLLPETHKLLRYQDYFQAPSLGKSWTTAFEKDLYDIPRNIEQFIIDQKSTSIDSTEIYTFFIGLFLLNQINDGANFFDVFGNLLEKFDQNNNSKINQHIISGIKFSYILSNELLASKDENGNNFRWITKRDFKELGMLGQRYFWSLIYRSNQIFFDESIGKIKHPAQFNGSYQMLSELLEIFNNINNTISLPLIDDSPNLSAKESCAQIIKGVEVFSMFDTLFNPINIRNVEFNFEKNLPLIENSLLLMDKIEHKKYGAMSIHLFKTIETAVPLVNNKNNPNTLNFLFFYVNFMTDIITNSGNIESIIESYAQPPQKYKMKKTLGFQSELK